MTPYIKVLRPRQWVKNILIFLPALLAHTLEPVVSLGIAFIAFSCVTSAGYILNDIMDVEADRKHSFKKNRPIASGALKIRTAQLYWPVLFVVGCVLGFIVRPAFFGILVLYFLITNIYNVFLKERVLVDVMILAGLYTLRLFAGSVIAEVTLSEWFLSFSVFLFTSLAFIKRQTELLYVIDQHKENIPRRGYIPEDVPFLTICGLCSGYLSALVLALYINSEKITTMYQHPFLLWSICPILIYWISRIWLLTLRKTMHSDPIVFVLKDKTSLFLIMFSIIIIVLAAQ